MRIILLLSCFFIFQLSVWSQRQSKTITKLDHYMADILQQWNIPGMGVAIIKNGEVILSKGYGVKNINTQEAVDEHTVFAIASNTKAFTAAALAQLVDDGLINWDDKVQTYLPWFQLYDPYVSANITIRDLLCHRSGLATFSGDLLWYGSSHSREDVLRKARYLEPACGFREAYGYQNIMYLAAGQIIPEVTGKSWEEYIQEAFLIPLGMNHTLTSVNQIKPGIDVASPHNERDGQNHVIDWVNWDNIAPAGALISSVHDMSKWLQLQLNQGIWEQDTLISSQALREMWTVQTPQRISVWSEENFPGKTFAGYGLGWELSNYRGKKIISHGGGYDGMISKTVLIPSEGIGIVILTNNINFLPFGLGYQIVDALLDVKYGTDYGKMLLEYKKEQEEEAKVKKAQEEEMRIPHTSPSLALEEYAGTYLDKMYGEIEIRVIGDQLAFQFVPTPIFRGTLRHWHYDTFQLNWGTQMMLPSGTAQFGLDTKGHVSTLNIDVPNPDFDFTELKFKKVD